MAMDNLSLQVVVFSQSQSEALCQAEFLTTDVIQFVVGAGVTLSISLIEKILLVTESAYRFFLPQNKLK